MLFQRQKLASKPQGGELARQELQHVEINGFGFVSNLLWHPLSNARSYMREAKIFGKSHHCDIVAVRRGTRIQAGFVSSGSQKLKGMYSLAASLAHQHGDAWMGAFALKDGRYAVVAVYDNLVCPGYDVICDAKRAKKMLVDGLSLYKFADEAIFAPADFEFAAQEGDIYALLTPKKLHKSNKLKQLTFGMTGVQIALMACGVLVVAGLAAGYYQWSEAQEEKRLAAIQTARAAEEKRLAVANAQLRKKLELEALAHPWATQPLALDFATECSKITARLPLSIDGWLFGNAVCAGESVQVQYDRKTGATLEAFKAAVVKVFGEKVVYHFQGGDIAIVSLTLTVMGGGEDRVDDADVSLPRFLSHFQMLDIATTLDEVAVKIEPPKVPPGQPPIEAPAATWRQYHFAFDGAIEPLTHFLQRTVGAPYQEVIVPGLKDIAGLRIDTIKTTLAGEGPSLTWHIEGNIYAKK